MLWGVSTQLDVTYHARTVVVTTGTFLQGLMHVGLRNTPGGRMGDSASGLSASLLKLGFELKRLKTGTPPRLLKKSINFGRMDLQEGDRPPKPFSYLVETLRKGRDDIFTLNEWRDGMFHVGTIGVRHHLHDRRGHIRSCAQISTSRRFIAAGSRASGRATALPSRTRWYVSPTRSGISFSLEPEGRHTDEYYINGCSDQPAVRSAARVHPVGAGPRAGGDHAGRGTQWNTTSRRRPSFGPRLRRSG